MSQFSELQRVALGMDQTPLIPLPERPTVRVHGDALPYLRALRDAARRAGFALEVASGYRSFDRQLAIFNAKARGERPVLDTSGEAPVALERLAPLERVEAILRWSALPGASRHHWGTDFDIYDAAAVEADYDVQLTPAECAGPFAALHAWLDEHAAHYGFFRPYARDRGGVAPERWHLSCAPVAKRFASVIDPPLLAAALAPVAIELKEAIEDNIEPLFRRFVASVDSPASEPRHD